MLTDYRYKKCRKLVKTSSCGDNYKKVFLSALHAYRYKNVNPIIKRYKSLDDTQCCLIGAAIVDEGVDLENSAEFDVALDTFSQKHGVITSLIISGFDDGSYGDHVTMLASKLRIELFKKAALVFKKAAPVKKQPNK